MNFEISSELSYHVNADTTFVFNLQPTETSGQRVVKERLVTSPGKVAMESFEWTERRARLLRVRVTEPGPFKIQYEATVSGHLKSVRVNQESILQPARIRQDALAYLFPSRYCQVDRMYKFAATEFKSERSTYGKVMAICDWIFNTVQYVVGSTNVHTSAIETITQREGVCRDFAHLAIVLCRALSIPARYTACYAYGLNQPDFHACFEAFMDGKWILFDATRLVPLHGLIKIAHGYDAADTSFANIFGDASPTSVRVTCDVQDRKAFSKKGATLKLISLD